MIYLHIKIKRNKYSKVTVYEFFVSTEEKVQPISFGTARQWNTI